MQEGLTPRELRERLSALRRQLPDGKICSMLRLSATRLRAIEAGAKPTAGERVALDRLKYYQPEPSSQAALGAVL